MRPRNVLLIRLSAIGDIVMATPVLRAIKSAWPGCRVSWLVEDRYASILSAHPSVDEVISWPKDRYKALIRERKIFALVGESRRFGRELKARKFDLAIDMQGLLKSAVWAYLSGAPERIGLRSKEGSQVMMTRIVKAPGDDAQISSEYLALIKSLGIEGDFRMELAVLPEDDEFAKRVRLDNGIEDGYFVLCPFTTRPQKHWIEERWAETARAVRDSTGLVPVILGGPGDAAASRRIESSFSGFVNLAGKSTLSQTMALIKNSSLLIGVDTGLTHMGIAFGVPTVAIFGPTRPYLDTKRADAIVLYKGQECSPCRRRPVCSGGYGCMAAVTVHDAVDAAIRALPAR